MQLLNELCLLLLRMRAAASIPLSARGIREARSCKTWTGLESGLWTGLDYVLDSGLDWTRRGVGVATFGYRLLH